MERHGPAWTFPTSLSLAAKQRYPAGMAEFLSIGTLVRPVLSWPAHRHDCWEFVLYTRGRGTITIGDRGVPFSRGTIVCLPPRIPHHEVSDNGFTNIFLTVRDWMPPTSAPVPTFSDDASGSWLRLATHLHRESCLRHPQWQVMCQRLTDLLLGYLERWASAEAPTGVVDRLKSLLVAGAHDPEFGVGDALRALPCSADHARRLFARATGIAPVDYLGSLRLDAAKRHLLGGAGVAEAADRAGFADPYYFSRVFARSEGMPPSRWAAQRRTS